jgi:hypothetical protein
MIDLVAVIGMAALVALMVALLGVGVAKSTALAGDPESANRRGIWVIFALQIWLGLVAVLAFRGVFSDWSARPPRLALFTLAAFLMIVLINRTKTLNQLIASTPRHWLIAAQTFRVAVELVLFAFYVDGHVPLQLTFEGRNVDILAGLTAPIVAWLVARHRVKLVAVIWNVLGIAVLLNTIVVFQTSLPGPLYAHWPGAPLTSAGEWPLVWLPTFLAPLAIFLHVVSFRQFARDARPSE